MLFSNLVATLRADLDAIRDDLGEFVTTVKTDATAALGLDEGANGGTGGSVRKYLQWEEELWDNPELLCEDPPEDDPEWTTFLAANLVKDEENEALLSGGSSDIVPELYRELVPSKATHSEFFQRLVFHRNRINQATRLRMQGIVEEEEETRWEDDDEIDEIVRAVPAISQPQAPVAGEEEKVVSDLDEADSKHVDRAIVEEFDKYKKDTEKQIRDLVNRVTELESALSVSESKRKELEAKLATAMTYELPHKKPPTLANDPTKLVVSVPELEQSKPIQVSVSTGSLPSNSWEQISSPPSKPSSNEEPMVVDLKEEEEEDDWE